MPTNSIALYHMQDSRNNLDAMRPAPICPDANQFMGQCQKIHISTNCYYGYHDHTNLEKIHMSLPTDCEMVEVAHSNHAASASPVSPQSNARKRSAEDSELNETRLAKHFREEVQRERNIEPETKENLDSRTEETLESLMWNIHGGTLFHLIQCL